MELTPSFKVKVLKEWGIVYVSIGVYALLTGIAGLHRMDFKYEHSYL